MGDPVVHFEIAGSDGDRLSGFYEQLFDWKVGAVESSQGGYRIADTGGEGINGGLLSFPGVPAYVTFYVRVRDLEASVARAESLGASTVMAPREVWPGLRSAMITDPEGNMVGMISPTASERVGP